MHAKLYRNAIVSGLVLTLGGVPSWGGQPPGNDVSDLWGNTGGGSATLESNDSGTGNTAYGFGALFNNGSGNWNTASGHRALYNNHEGESNTAAGVQALYSNTTGSNNTAIGLAALYNNSTGLGNSAMGRSTLVFNTTGRYNTASGIQALYSNGTGNNNTALGVNALLRSTGSNNIAIGVHAGANLTSGNANIYLGSGGAATESRTMRLGSTQTRIFIAGISGVPVNGSTVIVNSSGQLGILASSARYKERIEDLGERSRKVLELRPVAFHYQQDAQGQQQFGLIAEEVARVYPELVTRTATGEPESVQYHALVALLLNEIQRQQQQIGAQNQFLTIQARTLDAQTQQLAELQAQHAALANRLLRLEKRAARAMILTSR